MLISAIGKHDWPVKKFKLFLELGMDSNACTFTLTLRGKPRPNHMGAVAPVKLWFVSKNISLRIASLPSRST